MPLIFIVVVLLLILFGPQWWAQRVLRRHSAPRADFPGSGAELARHLLDRFGLHEVKVEVTDRDDHYDPRAKAVRLSQERFDGRSLTAVVVAAHEVGHAIQDHLGYPPLQWRQYLVTLAQRAERLGAVILMILPLAALLTRSPVVTGFTFLVGLATLASTALVHLITLPVELDASFNRALPLLRAGRFLGAGDERAAYRILHACALTYLAASLAGLFNFWRWLRLWRR